MATKKIVLSIAVIFAIAALGAGGFFIFKLKNKPAEKPQVGQEKNYFEINDELAGVSFKIGKNFDRMSARELQMKNPGFIYGFSAKNDASASCFVSQTKREPSGQVTVGQLRDGVLKQLKKSSPDAKIDEVKIIDIGENNNKGIKVKMRYTEADKIPMVQWEIAGITGERATFAFCGCSRAVIDLYREDFELFLESVRVK